MSEPEYMDLASRPLVLRAISRVWQLDSPALLEPFRRLRHDAAYLPGGILLLGQADSIHLPKPDLLAILRDLFAVYIRSKPVMLEHADALADTRPSGLMVDAGLGQHDYGSGTRAAFVIPRRYADLALGHPGETGVPSPEAVARRWAAIHPAFSAAVLRDTPAFSVIADAADREIRALARLTSPPQPLAPRPIPPDEPPLMPPWPATNPPLEGLCPQTEKLIREVYSRCSNGSSAKRDEIFQSVWEKPFEQSRDGQAWHQEQLRANTFLREKMGRAISTSKKGSVTLE